MFRMTFLHQTPGEGSKDENLEEDPSTVPSLATRLPRALCAKGLPAAASHSFTQSALREGLARRGGSLVYPERFARRATCLILALCLFAVISPNRVLAQSGPAQQSDFYSIAKAATAARESGDTAAAIRSYKRSVELHPDWQEGWWYLGTLQYDADRYADAIPAFQNL